MQNSFKETLYYSPKTRLMLDWGGMRMDDEFKNKIKAKLDASLKAMGDLDAGAIANPSEGRMVGHYWLRAPKLAPTAELTKEIEDCTAAVLEFTEKVHSGEIKSPAGKKFKKVVVASIVGAIMLIVVLVSVILYQVITMSQYVREKNALLDEITKLERLIDENADEALIRQTKEWIEDRARELGYKYKDDIILDGDDIIINGERFPDILEGLD